MTKILAFLKKIWLLFNKVAIAKTFVFAYPLLVLTVIAIATHSLLVSIALLIWAAALILNIDEN